jgi:uncharacterized RDD family membrane protein YckC
MEPDETTNTSSVPTHVWPKHGGLAVWSQISEQRELIARVAVDAPLRVLAEHERYYEVAFPPHEAPGFVLKDAVAQSREEAVRRAQAEAEQASAYVDAEEWTPGAERQPYASFGRRAVGFLLDWAGNLVVALAATLVLYTLLLPDYYTQNELDSARLKVSLTVAALLVPYLWISDSYGGTLGKRIVGIRVIADATGEAPGLRRGGIRFLMSILSRLCLWLGYVMDQNGKTWHDRAAGTIVVPRRNAKKIGDT